MNQGSQGELQLSDTRTKPAMTSCVLSFRGCCWDLSCWEVGLSCQSSHSCDQSQPGLCTLRDPRVLALEPVTLSRRQLDLRKGSSISNLESTSIEFLLIWNSLLGRNIKTSCVLIGRKLLALSSLTEASPFPLLSLDSPLSYHTTLDVWQRWRERRILWTV